jgi:Flp pilus assembly protein TadG
MYKKKGYAAILLVLLLPIIIMIMGICIDIGNMVYCEAKLMSAVKFAAISASSNYTVSNNQVIITDEQQDFVQTCLTKNYEGAMSKTFTVDAVKKNQCTVEATAEVKFYFLTIIKINSETIDQSYTVTRNLD